MGLLSISGTAKKMGLYLWHLTLHVTSKLDKNCWPKGFSVQFPFLDYLPIGSVSNRLNRWLDQWPKWTGWLVKSPVRGLYGPVPLFGLSTNWTGLKSNGSTLPPFFLFGKLAFPLAQCPLLWWVFLAKWPIKVGNEPYGRAQQPINL